MNNGLLGYPGLPSNAGDTLGDLPEFNCRAWVTFVGSTGAVLASGNVSSVTRTSTGTYTINFIVAMPDANYAVIGSARSVSADYDYTDVEVRNGTPPTNAGVTISVVNTRGGVGLTDHPAVYVAIFR